MASTGRIFSQLLRGNSNYTIIEDGAVLIHHIDSSNENTFEVKLVQEI